MHVSDVGSNVGKEVELRGWVYRKRSSGSIFFIVLRDSTGIIQMSAKKGVTADESWKAVGDANIEASIIVNGTVKEEKRAPTGFELEIKTMKLVGNAEPYPITEYQSPELLLDNRHLWLRSRKMTDIMRFRAMVFKYFRDYFFENQFWEVTPPLITKAGGESGADMFALDYFGEKAYLTQSSQLYLEVEISALEKVYCLVPSYRAEKSRTIKHLAEYWHLEVEAAYYSNKDNMDLQEDLLSYLCGKIVKEQTPLLESLGVDKKRLEAIKPPFKRLTYSQALEELNKKGVKKEWLDDLGVEDERMLTAEEKKPMFIYKWPLKIKSFYMRADPDDPEFALNSDLQAPQGHGEIIGGSERIWDYNELKSRIKEMGLSEKNYEWYTDLRKYGSVPHSGFGLGTERVIKWLLDLDHIRDAIPFPRMINRIYP